MFEIKADSLQLVKKTVALPLYSRDAELNAFISSAKRDLTAKDFRDAGFEELVDGDESPVSGARLGRMDDNAQCYIYKYDFLLIDQNLAHIRAKEIIQNERYKDVFEFCVDDDEGSNSKHREESILEGLNKYKALYDKIGERIKSEDYGVERIDDHVLKDGILRSLVFIYDRPFMQIVMNLSNKGQITYSPNQYFDARYIISMSPIGSISFNFIQENGKYQHTDYKQEDWDKMLEKVFKLPSDLDKKKETVRRKVKKYFRKNVNSDDIAYDRMNNCYYLRNEVSEETLKPFMPEISKEQFVGKYTTTNTLFEILKSGKIRLNSIVSMNDKTETSFLSDLTKNYDEPLETTELSTITANATHIISFSTNTDNLDMWRWYGDDGKGVCLVFERDIEKDEELMQVTYVDAKLQRRINQIREFLKELKKDGVDFRFHLLEDSRHYLKPKEYKPENESRMIVKSGQHDGWFIHGENGIMTPYIEAKLVNAMNCEKEGVFPYRLSKVILGPKFRENSINKTQIRMMCFERGWLDVEIVESEIKSYR
jgi:hypothetical protein